MPVAQLETFGVGHVARAAADGYTLGVGSWGQYVVNSATYALRCDARTDFEPVALMSSYPVVVAAKHSLPPNDLSGLIGWLKANPDKASSGTSGVGTSSTFRAYSFRSSRTPVFNMCPIVVVRGNRAA